MDLSPFRVLSLCAGIGGLDLGLKLAVSSARTVCYVEREIPACAILATRMEEGYLDAAPIWTGLRTFGGKPWRGVVDCVIGGYPCQPFSAAGRRRGVADPRHLWPEIKRIIGEVEPRFCFFENVPPHLGMGFREVRSDLQGLGFQVTAGLFTAAEIGASHLRQRLFILAYAGRGSKHAQQYASWPGRSTAAARSGREDVDDADGAGLEAGAVDEPGGWPGAFPPGPAERERWAAILECWPEVEPAVCRVADGSTNRVDRLRAVGNAAVPGVAALAWRTLWAEMSAK